MSPCPVCGGKITYQGLFEVKCDGVSCENFEGWPFETGNFTWADDKVKQGLQVDVWSKVSGWEPISIRGWRSGLGLFSGYLFRVSPEQPKSEPVPAPDPTGGGFFLPPKTVVPPAPTSALPGTYNWAVAQEAAGWKLQYQVRVHGNNGPWTILQPSASFGATDDRYVFWDII